MNTLDTLDKKLIGILQQNSRQSSELLAKQLGVSPATVRRRIRRLITKGVIRIGAIVDHNKAGLPLAAVFALDVAPDKLDSTMQTLSSLPDVKWISTTTGRFDILAGARFPSTKELSDFVQKELTKVEGVRNSETFVCLNMNSKQTFI